MQQLYIKEIKIKLHLGKRVLNGPACVAHDECVSSSHECSYCRFISLFSLSVILPLTFDLFWTCRLLSCFLHPCVFLFFLFCSSTSTISSSQSSATMHANQWWDIAFLILLTEDNICVLFFQYPFFSLTYCRFAHFAQNIFFPPTLLLMPVYFRHFHYGYPLWL